MKTVTLKNQWLVVIDIRNKTVPAGWSWASTRKGSIKNFLDGGAYTWPQSVKDGWRVAKVTVNIELP